jgi:hypothetical protein
MKALAAPLATEVSVGPEGRPAAVRGVPVIAVREEWVVEDRWWAGRPLRRRYFELVLEDGSCAVVFRDLVAGSWASHRG